MTSPRPRSLEGHRSRYTRRGATAPTTKAIPEAPTTSRGAAPLMRCSLSVLVLSVKPRLGGAWGWLVVRVGCARTPSLISVRDPGWLRIGDDSDATSQFTAGRGAFTAGRASPRPRHRLSH